MKLNVLNYLSSPGAVVVGAKVAAAKALAHKVAALGVISASTEAPVEVIRHAFYKITLLVS